MNGYNRKIRKFGILNDEEFGDLYWLRSFFGIGTNGLDGKNGFIGIEVSKGGSSAALCLNIVFDI